MTVPEEYTFNIAGSGKLKLRAKALLAEGTRCSRARLKVVPRADPLTRRDGFAEDGGSMGVGRIWAEISDFG